MNTCRICGNSAWNKTFVAREMMFGLREPFEYFECSQCACLQISVVPKEMSKYYPEQRYYSVRQPAAVHSRAGNLRQRLRQKRITDHINGGGLAAVLSKTVGDPAFFPWLKIVQARADHEILDVGCGSGKLLLEMKRYGFSRLTGIEPLLSEDLRYENGPTILKRSADDIEGAYDLIMAHHSFEHLPSPLATLRRFHRCLKPSRFVLLRLPISSSYAWRHFGVNWVQMDAPRHFYLHSLASMGLLAEAAGFEVRTVLYDSTEFQFWGSRQYELGIPLHDPRSYAVDPGTPLFSKAEIEGFRAQAEKLNREGQGDQAAFFLFKP